jgi:hypothetical protein
MVIARMTDSQPALTTYVNFVLERHEVWKARQQRLGHPWTVDPVIATRKFTNVFRILDHGTQFVVRELLEPDLPFHDILARVFLYRYTNRPEPWEHFRDVVGRYPVAHDLRGRLQTVWGTYNASGQPIFGNAYKMFSGAENKGQTRLGWCLNMVKTHVTPILANRIVLAPDMETRFTILKEVPRCADFMAMQILTDLGYTDTIKGDENEFIAPGPGARKGASLIFPHLNPVETIHYLHDIWRGSVVRLPEIDRPPSLMDVQNTLCEFSKYDRWRQLPVRSKPYTPAHPKQYRPVYPLHWRPEQHAQPFLPYSL